MTAPRIIDSHVHFWRLDRGDYHWMTPDMTAIRRDFGPADLAPLRRVAGVDQVVLVQAAATVAETRFMLEIADGAPEVASVVGWVDMVDQRAPDTLAELAEHPRFRGISQMIHDILDPDWMLRDDLTPAFRAVVDLGLSFDCLVRPQHLPALRRLLDRHPDMTAIIDHCAKPDIAAGAFDDWAADMAALARDTAAACKLSGLITEAGPRWSTESLRPFAEHVLSSFGPDRILWGSDWPVLTMTASYADWWQAARYLTADLPATDRAKVFGGTAQRVYRLPV